MLNTSTKLALGQGGAPTLTIMGTPSKQLMLMGIFDSTGTVTGVCALNDRVVCMHASNSAGTQGAPESTACTTAVPIRLCCMLVLASAIPLPPAGSVTASNVFNQPGLQATFTGTPAIPGKVSSLSAASLTVDYTTPFARLRCGFWPGITPGSVIQRQQHMSTALYANVPPPTGSSAHYNRTCMRPAAARSSKDHKPAPVWPQAPFDVCLLCASPPPSLQQGGCQSLGPHQAPPDSHQPPAAAVRHSRVGPLCGGCAGGC